jgi:tetratricopeptide (TPR) repeat protein
MLSKMMNKPKPSKDAWNGNAVGIDLHRQGYAGGYVDKEKQTLCWGAWFLQNIQRKPPSIVFLIGDKDDNDDSSTDVETAHSADTSEWCEEYSVWRQAEILENRGHLCEALDIYESLFDVCIFEDLGNLRHRMGILHWKRGAYATSLKHLNLAIDGCGNEAEVFLAMGRTHLSRGDRKRARKAFKKAKVLHDAKESDVEGSHDNVLLAKAFFHGLGMVCEADGAFECALDHCRQALCLQRRHKHVSDSAATLLTLASVHEKLGSYDRALSCLGEAYNIFVSCNCVGYSTVDMAVALTSIGWIHFLQGRHENALQVYQEALLLLRPLGAHRNVASVLAQAGMVQAAMKQYHKACELYKQAIRIQRDMLGDRHEANVSEEMGRHQEFQAV